MAHECVILDLNPRLAARREATRHERDAADQARLEREWLNANTNPLTLGDAGE